MLMLFTACEKGIIKENPQGETLEDNGQQEVVEQEKIEKEEEMSEEGKDLKKDIDLSLNPNEAGQTMILMYHNIGEVEEEWTRTPDNFRNDLKKLYELGYRAVSLKDYVNNTMNVEAGKTPVVITFDDGNENNFKIVEDSNKKSIIDPNSAVGILEEFKNDYPDFNTTATFFVFGTNAFRQPEFLDYKLNYLVDNGYDIGNHTFDHRSMKKADGMDYIQEGIGKQIKMITTALPEYQVNTYALCYGERPKDEGLVTFLEKGQYSDISYKNIAILNVGWNPVNSPISVEFNPLSLPRIRASEMNVDNVGIYNWIDYFEQNPDKRYISDGVGEIVTVPKELEETVNKEKILEKQLYLYENIN